MAKPAPKAPSPLIRLSRWSMLALGIIYGVRRNSSLTEIETARRAREEAERPAKEAAVKEERQKKYKEEMEYLARETGVKGQGLTPGDEPPGAPFESPCGCKF